MSLLDRTLAALRQAIDAPLLLVDGAAAFLGPASSTAAGLRWEEVARRLLREEAGLRVEGGPGFFAVIDGSPLPAGLAPLLAAARPCSAGHVALAAALGDAAAPWALFEGGRLAWATPGLWLCLGIGDGARLGSLFVHPDAPSRAADLERAVAGGALPFGTEIVQLPDGCSVLRPRDLAASLAEARVERLAASWGLTPAERRELEHLRHGRTSKEAATLEGISPETNRQRRRQIFAKARVSSAGALRAALEGLPHAGRRGA